MSRLLCCLCVRRADMGAALSVEHVQEGQACDGAGLPAAPPTMADVIRERKKKAGGAGLGTLRRRLAAAARRPRDSRPDRGCEHARFIRSVVSSWRLAEVFLLCEELEAGAALRDLATRADLAREPAAALHADLAAAHRDRWWFDVELVGAGWSLGAHRAVLAARCTYFRDLLQRYPSGSCRVPLSGPAAALSRAEMEACLCALYQGASHCSTSLCPKCERDVGSEGELDIINVDNTAGWRGVGACSCGAQAGALRRLGARLGFSLTTLGADMRYLLDSGEYADARLVFRLEGGCGAQYGFRSALELPCHRVVLAARSRFFRSVMSRRTAQTAGASAHAQAHAHTHAVCVDEKVLPRRFARALLHAAYTDLVDLSLIGRGSSSPASTNSASSGGSAWPGVARSASGASTSTLDDAFQLYEIARFLEMPIVVQGCEDAIAEALSPETLPHVLRWAAAAHASHWVHRQAMRYLRDEFPAIMSHAASARLPRAALADALASPFLQASEAQALRALLRWAERAAGCKLAADLREPNVVWHTAHSVSRRGARRRSVSDAALRSQLASLVPLLRLEHLPPDSELLLQAVRRGLVPAPAPQEESAAADAWLGRGSARPPRCFLPYLDEIKALLEDQVKPELEVARLRRARYLHRIPDTLYMVAAARGTPPAPSAATSTPGAETLCVSPRVLGALRARVRELSAAPPVQRVAGLCQDLRARVRRQIALRAVREMSLPDECADLLINDDAASDRERSGEWGDSPQPAAWAGDVTDECCRGAGGAGGGYLSLSASAASLRVNCTELHAHDESRSSTCRRELPPHARADHSALRVSAAECATRARLSAAVPDVAMAPNANTHLLTARDYFRHPPVEYSGGVLQLDLGDGATHTPRPGSRAQRAAQYGERARRDVAPALALACARPRVDEDELRAAIELSVIRAYSSFHPMQAAGAAAAAGAGSSAHSHTHAQAAAGAGAGAARRPLTHTLPASCYRQERVYTSTARARGSPPPSRGAHVSATPPPAAAHTPPPPPPRHIDLHLAARRVSSAESRAASTSASPSPSPRRRDYAYRQHDYRLEASYGSSGSGSRGQSPNNYA